MRKKDIKKRHKVRDNSRDEIRNGKKCNIEKWENKSMRGGVETDTREQQGVNNFFTTMPGFQELKVCVCL